MTLASELCVAARVLAANGLVDAFGHVSARNGGGMATITPALPLGSLRREDELVELPLTGEGLPRRAPREAWIHRAIYDARPEVVAVCRAQPNWAAAAAAAAVPIVPLSGQGALLGAAVPMYGDARLVRDPSRAEELASTLASEAAVVMRGNGAVTVGRSVGEAVARMYLLDASARLNLAAAAASDAATPLSEAEVVSWLAVGEEIAIRLWEHLAAAQPVLEESLA